MWTLMRETLLNLRHHEIDATEHYDAWREWWIAQLDREFCESAGIRWEDR